MSRTEAGGGGARAACVPLRIPVLGFQAALADGVAFPSVARSNALEGVAP